MASAADVLVAGLYTGPLYFTIFQNWRLRHHQKEAHECLDDAKGKIEAIDEKIDELKES